MQMAEMSKKSIFAGSRDGWDGPGGHCSHQVCCQVQQAVGTLKIVSIVELLTTKNDVVNQIPKSSRRYNMFQKTS